MNEEAKNTQETPKAETAKKSEEKGWFGRNWPWVATAVAVVAAAGGAAFMIFGGSAEDAAAPVQA